MENSGTTAGAAGDSARQHYFRFHAPHAHLHSAFGGDWFGLRAEAFARFFGAPTFLIAQTVLIALWIAATSQTTRCARRDLQGAVDSPYIRRCGPRGANGDQ